MLRDTLRLDETIQKIPKHGDHIELLMLRASVGQLCSAADVETATLPVVGKTLDQLVRMAKDNNRGWNTLVEALIRKVNDDSHTRNA